MATTRKGEVRPATILGPYGEGYCRHCRFIEGLDEYGLINVHAHGAPQQWELPKPCKGSGTVPPKLTPYASDKSRFRSWATTGECPECRRRMEVLKTETGNYFLPYHTAGYGPGVKGCPGVNRAPVMASVRIGGARTKS